MHGYEIIAELSSRTDGAWSPSPGSVYPTLALLEDEGVVASIDDGGKRRFSLTPAGEELVAQRRDAPPPWEEIKANTDPDLAGLRESGMLLFAALSQVGRAGSSEQIRAAGAMLDDARRRIYGLLAEPTAP
jgi:DNA-binding PadR family transcriptional regulator